MAQGSQKPKLQFGALLGHSELPLQALQLSGTDPPGGEDS
jgi:hypothetical protein